MSSHEKMRLGFIGPDPFTPSGYGRHILVMSGMLKKDNIFHIIMGNQHFSSSIDFNGVIVTPRKLAPYLSDVVPYFVNRHHLNTVINVFDFWVMDYLPELKKRQGTRYVHWIPVDSPMKEGSVSEETLRTLKEADEVMAVSRYSASQLKNVGIDAAVVQLGVDSKVFRPLENRKETRKRMGFGEDDFIIGLVGTNMGNRKDIPALIKATKYFADGLPEGERKKVKLYLHTPPKVQPGAGLDFLRYAKFIGWKEEQTLFPAVDAEIDTFPDDIMNEITNSWDVAAYPTKGEGFGLPILEAMSCGIPVVAHDCSSVSELLEGTDNIGVPSLEGSGEPGLWTGLITEYPKVDIYKFADGLEKIYGMPEEERQKIGMSGRRKAEKYTWEETYRKFKTMLQTLVL